MKIVCVIPAYNESARVGAVIRDVLPLVNQVIVVDDGSTDETCQTACRSGATALRLPINRGQGAALRVGTEFALANGADLIIHFDADGQFQASDLPAIILPLATGAAQIVLGSRFLTGQQPDMPWFKLHILFPLAKVINRCLFGVCFSDPQSGLRAFAATAFPKLHWHQDRMAHCSEIQGLIQRSGLPVVEVPITVLYHRFGQGLGGGGKILVDLFLGALSR